MSKLTIATRTIARFSLPLCIAAGSLAALLLVPTVASAQVDPNLERGFAADKVYDFGQLDSVNLFNGSRPQ